MPEFKILFIYPNLRGMNMLPPAIAIFSRILKNNNFSVALFDTTYYRIGEFDSDKEKEKNLQVRPFDMSKQVTLKTSNHLEDLDKLVNSYRPDLIALSATEDIFPGGLKLLQHIDKYNIPTIAGGVYPTFTPDKVIRNKEIDIVCIGEGEEAILELCTRMREGRDYSDIGNLWVKDKSGRVIKNPIKYLHDINVGILPDFTLFEESRFYRPMAGKIYRMFPVETHRGCPYQCTYCNAPVQRKLYDDAKAGSFLRKKKISLVKKEIEFYRDTWKAEYLYFWAETFLTYTNEEFEEFVSIYKNIKLPFWCQTRPETVNEDRLKRLKDVGLHRISIGIEHGNEEFRRKVIKRSLSNDVIVKAIDIIAGCNLPAGISVNNIVGFPDETPELAMDTIELNRRIADKVDTTNCYAFVPYHGTPLHALSVKRGYIHDDTPTSCLTGDPVLQMPQFSQERIKGIMRTFSMYVKFDKKRWPEIKQAESFTPEGNRIFETLRSEYLQEFFTK